jgi:hypothetical protein
MIKSTFYSLVMASMLLSFVAQADAPVSLSVASSRESVFNIHYKAVEPGTVKVTIFNHYNEIVFSEVLFNIASFTRPYNFTGLTEGEYTVVVEGRNGRQVEKINHTLNKVSRFVHVTKLAQATKKYLLSVTSTGTENVWVRIYAQDGTQLHEEKMQVSGSAAIIFDLSQVKHYTSSVTFEVTTGTYTQQFTQL